MHLMWGTIIGHTDNQQPLPTHPKRIIMTNFCLKLKHENAINDKNNMKIVKITWLLEELTRSHVLDDSTILYDIIYNHTYPTDM